MAELPPSFPPQSPPDLPEAEVAAAGSHLEDLVSLARSRAEDSRRVLLDNMSDLFLSPANRLSERERILMTQIIERLLLEVEIEVRRALAERLAETESAPPELVALLANDEIAVARPVLLQSPLLHDADLIEVVKLRGREHRLAVAMRQGLAAAVADALIELGDEQVIETLIANHDAALSRQAIDYLVEESKRIDRFQEPLLRRPDLPPALAHRMFWWVSAGLRHAILLRHDIAADRLDDLLESATGAALAQSPQARAGEAEKLAGQVAEAGGLSERYIVQNLRRGHIGAAIAGLAKLGRIDMPTARRILLDPGGEALAACCRAADFSRQGFAATFLLSREAHDHGHAMAAGRVEEMLALFDRMTEAQARAALRYWAHDNQYALAVANLAAGRQGRPGEWTKA